MSSVSAKVTVAPSTQRTGRPCHCHPSAAFPATIAPVSRTRVDIIGNGNRPCVKIDVASCLRRDPPKTGA